MVWPKVPPPPNDVPKPWNPVDVAVFVPKPPKRGADVVVVVPNVPKPPKPGAAVEVAVPKPPNAGADVAVVFAKLKEEVDAVGAANPVLIPI